MKKILISFSMIALMATSCYYDKEETLYPTIECQTNNVRYSVEVSEILDASCMTCHSAAANFGNITLEGYENLKTYVDNGQFLGSIKHEDGFSAMPKGTAKLLDCNIEKIEQWIADGAPNN